MGSRTDEFRAGLAATRPYLLSHHEPAEYDRCYLLRVGSRQVRLCARCSGIYPGILAGLVVATLGLASALQPVAIVAFPAPAVIDWARSALGDAEGTNPVRTLTGVLLGGAYGLGLWTLLWEQSLWVLPVGAGYGLAAFGLLYLSGALDEAL